MSTLDKHMLKELLLVCSALGSVETSELDTEAPPEQRFVRGENCLEWLQDLQRYVRAHITDRPRLCIDSDRRNITCSTNPQLSTVESGRAVLGCLSSTLETLGRFYRSQFMYDDPPLSYRYACQYVPMQSASKRRR